MDADITVIQANLQGQVFDPQNKEHVALVSRTLGDTITVYNDFGMPGELSKEEWGELISGNDTEMPFFSEEDLKGKKPGDSLPDNQVISRPMIYTLLELNPDNVKCVRNGRIGDVRNGAHNFPWELGINADKSIEEIAHDMVHLTPPEFRTKYRIFRSDFRYNVFTFSRIPKHTKNNDVWRWLEGKGIFEAIQQAGFNIIKSREKGKVTYAALPSAKITDIKIVKK
jgi:hypothetical protein